MTLRRAFAILLFAQLVSLGTRETPDPDMWWHLRTGELIWQGGIPQRDVFSFTVPDHVWITHEWLSDALMWGIYRIGGLRGLIAVFALLPAWALWLMYRRSDGRPYLAGLIVILAAFTGFASFGVRPQVFNLLMGAAFVNRIEGFKDHRVSGRGLLLLPLLSVLWANLHSAQLLGAGLLAIYVCGETLDRWWNPTSRTLTRVDSQRLAIVALACCGAGLLNPNGWRLLAFPLETFGSGAIQQNIAEWGSPDFHSYLEWPFAAMLFIGAVTWAFSRTPPSWSDVLLFVAGGAAGLLSRRHIALFATLVIPAIARSVVACLRDTKAYPLLGLSQVGEPPRRQRRWLDWAVLIVGLSAMVASSAKRLTTIDTAIAKAYPVAAVDFLERHALTAARGYNEYSWGGYLIWRHVPVFVDGRAELYGNDFLSRYFKTLRMTHDWRTPLDDFQVGYVLMTRADPLGTLLEASGEWREAFADDVARVFVRNERRRGG